MSNLLDVRGYSCPEPALKVKQYLEKTQVSSLEVLAGSSNAKDNIERIAKKKGYQVENCFENEYYKITIKK